MSMTKLGYNLALEPNITDWFLDEYKKHGSILGYIFGMEKSDNSAEIYASSSTLGDFTEFSGRVSMGDRSQGYSKTVKNKTFAKGFSITYDLYEDKKYKIIEEDSRGLGWSAKRTRERYALSLFVHAADTTFTVPYATGGTAEPLCYSAHASYIPGVAAQSNITTDSFGQASYTDAYRSMQNFTDWNGDPIDVAPDLALCHTTKEEAVYEVLESKLKSGEMSNTKNIANDRYRTKILTTPYLKDTPYNVFLINSIGSKRHLKYQNRKKLELFSTVDPRTFTMDYIGRYRMEIAPLDWRDVFMFNASS